MHNTGENEQALRKILDMTRLIAIIILLLHFYYQLYAAFREWGLVSDFSNRILGNITRTGIFHDFHRAKLIALGILLVSLIGARGRKSEKLNHRTALAYLVTGLITYFIAYFSLYIPAVPTFLAGLYMTITGTGFLLVLSGGTILSRILKNKFSNQDIFNLDNSTFPQQEELLTNQYSINLPMRYRLKDKWRNGWLNVLAVFRTSLISGSAGSAKTSGILRFFITQGLAKPQPFTYLLYDFKFPDLSLVAYNHFLKNKHRFKGKPECIFINLDDPSHSHRGNPLEPANMHDITDATESARTILLGLNKEWRKKQGDFFVESGINFVTAVIWFLRMYRGGIYCTLPHVIEMIQLEYDQLFTCLRSEESCQNLVGAFITAYLNDVLEQLEGQIGTAKIALARLSSPQLYYVLSGNDFNLQINDPEHPRILCLGNNPQKTQVYGAVLSLFTNRVLKVINKKNKLPCMVHLDELPTLECGEALLSTISTGRSNLNCVVMGVQSIHQLRREYGKEMADVIMSIAGNLIAGQETGDTAKQVSEQIGKIMQERESLSISDSGTSVSRSKQLEYAVPPSKISKLSSGQFVGVLADLPDQRVELKAFDCELLTDYAAINKEEESYKPIPLIRQVDAGMIAANFSKIKQDVKNIAADKIRELENDPAREHLVLRK
ncbi:putative Mn2+ efflux pump MntP [Pedobacter africanus]|uniref:conjugal transfer protein MobC n=1 Tax=Pedobacter africanus TaxID=151894 RepID=UPI003397E12A